MTHPSLVDMVENAEERIKESEQRKVTVQRESIIDEEEKEDSIIFISHRTTDKDVADILVDFFSGTGICKRAVFCSSLPGNDVDEKISGEVKKALKNSAINIAILSHDYYQSAYCLNEAGVLWYRDDVPVIPIALPEISENNMYGFLNNEYKLRRLDCDTDVSYVYDKVRKAISASQNEMSVITYEMQKLKERYGRLLGGRKESISTSPSDTLLDITTDDERIVLYYILDKKVRKVSKDTVVEWLHKKELHDVDVDNAFDLLSSLGGKVQNDALELGIEVFRKYSSNANLVLRELKPFVDCHIKLAAQTFDKLWKTDEMNSILKLFVAYICEERMISFGDRWMAEGQVESIKQWENKNTLFSTLSENYGSCLELFKQHELVYESSWTSYGNPREYTLYPSLQKHLFNDSNQYLEELQRVKNEHYCRLPF